MRIFSKNLSAKTARFFWRFCASYGHFLPPERKLNMGKVRPPTKQVFLCVCVCEIIAPQICTECNANGWGLLGQGKKNRFVSQTLAHEYEDSLLPHSPILTKPNFWIFFLFSCREKKKKGKQNGCEVGGGEAGQKHYKREFLCLTLLVKKKKNSI